MEKLKQIPKMIMTLPLKVAGLAVGLIYRVVRPIITSPIFTLVLMIPVFIAGFGLGARVFETGNSQKLGVDLKGANVRLSGPCRVDGEVRKPALAEDEVKIVSIDQKTIVGIVRATRETVECDVASTAIDALPLLSDLYTSPAVIPVIKPFEVNREDFEVSMLKKRTIRASGVCELKDGTATEPFIDQDIEVINVERSATDKSVIKISGIMKRTKASVDCTSKGIKYNVLNGSTEIQAGTPGVQDNKNIVGEIILVTSNCFPDRRLPPSKKNKTIFYPMIDARMKVVQATFDDEGKLQYLAGAVIENGALVECDSSRYPINWKPYDDRIKLSPIKGSVETTEEEQMERAAPAEMDASGAGQSN